MKQKSMLYEYWLNIERGANLSEINLRDEQKVWVFQLLECPAQSTDFDELLVKEFNLLYLDYISGRFKSMDSFFDEPTFRTACAFVKFLNSAPNTDISLLFAETVKIFNIISQTLPPPDRPDLPTNEKPQEIVKYREQLLGFSAKQALLDIEVFLGSPQKELNGYYLGIMKETSGLLEEYNSIQPEKAISNSARTASNKSHEAHREVMKYAISLYEKKEWSSIRHAAITIKSKVVKKSTKEGRELSENNAFHTIYKWLLQHNKKES